MSRRYDGLALRSDRRSPRSLIKVIEPWVQTRFDAACPLVVRSAAHSRAAFVAT